MKTIFIKIFDFFSSVKLAVILILALATILAVGTFYEAEYGTAQAQRVIYHSWYVTVEMFLLITNLVCAAVDRLPWKKNHVGFVVTHGGIIILILGSFITQQRGVDGVLPLSVGSSSDNFIVQDQELHVYQSLDGKPFALLIQTEVDFDRRPPPRPFYEFRLVDDDRLKVTHYIERAVRKVHVENSENQRDLPAIHFGLKNDRVAVSEWIALNPAMAPFYDLGPATVSIIRGPLPKPPQPRNQIVIYQETEQSPFKYAIFSKRTTLPTHQGLVKKGEPVDTGWMGLKFTVDEIHAHSSAAVTYEEGPPGSTNDGQNSPAVEIEVDGKRSWFELDSPHEIKSRQNTYFISYTRKRYELGFQIALGNFKMGLYGGSQMPSSYQSDVTVNHSKPFTISMNEPLKFNEYTLYQQSYELNERGEPATSILAVNYDPGRSMKYFGSICIVAGIGIMFYWKPRWTRKKRTVA